MINKSSRGKNNEGHEGGGNMKKNVLWSPKGMKLDYVERISRTKIKSKFLNSVKKMKKRKSLKKH